MDRRIFLASTIGGILASVISACAPAKAPSDGRRPRVLVNNGWQSQNIGDIAHYIGLFELMERYKIHDNTDVALWPVSVEFGAAELIKNNFPWVRIVDDRTVFDRGVADYDFLLHGSGAGFSSRDFLQQWLDSGKLYGVLGISIKSIGQTALGRLNRAEFVLLRDSVSLDMVKRSGCTAPVIDFGLDTAFGMTETRNDAAAIAFMQQHGLEEGRFLCCIPRYRNTPIWEVYPDRPVEPEAQARNEAMRVADHAPLRDAISAITRELGMKVLVTCEDQTQIRLGKEAIIDLLPDDVRANVVWRDHYWLPDEAIATYVRSAGVFGNEMHSPILSVANGVPAVVCRFAEQGNKGYMWRDIGLGDWLFDLDDPNDVARIPTAILNVARDPISAKAKVLEAQRFIDVVQDKNLNLLSETIKQAGRTA